MKFLRDLRSERGDVVREGDLRDVRGGVGAETREPRHEMRDRRLLLKKEDMREE